MDIAIKKFNEFAKTPTRGSDKAAGYDLYAGFSAAEFITIPPHKTVKVDTNIGMEIPSGMFGAIFARSGLATNKGLRPSNCVGVIDEDYRGHIIVALHNDTNSIQTIEGGSRIAQLILLPYWTINFEEVDELSDTDRGSGGFGSTGTN